MKKHRLRMPVNNLSYWMAGAVALVLASGAIGLSADRVVIAEHFLATG